MEKLDGLMVNKASVDALMAGETRGGGGDWREGLSGFVESGEVFAVLKRVSELAS